MKIIKSGQKIEKWTKGSRICPGCACEFEFGVVDVQMHTNVLTASGKKYALSTQCPDCGQHIQIVFSEIEEKRFMAEFVKGLPAAFNYLDLE